MRDYKSPGRHQKNNEKSPIRLDAKQKPHNVGPSGGAIITEPRQGYKHYLDEELNTYEDQPPQFGSNQVDKNNDMLSDL